MYWIPLLLIVALAVIAVGWTPLFAVVLALPAFFAYLVWVGMKRRSEDPVAPPQDKPAGSRDDRRRGAWGEPRD